MALSKDLNDKFDDTIKTLRWIQDNNLLFAQSIFVKENLFLLSNIAQLKQFEIDKISMIHQ